MKLGDRIRQIGESDPAVAWSILGSGIGIGMLVGVIYATALLH